MIFFGSWRESLLLASIKCLPIPKHPQKKSSQLFIWVATLSRIEGGFNLYCFDEKLCTVAVNRKAAGKEFFFVLLLLLLSFSVLLQVNNRPRKNINEYRYTDIDVNTKKIFRGIEQWNIVHSGNFCFIKWTHLGMVRCSWKISVLTVSGLLCWHFIVSL